MTGKQEVQDTIARVLCTEDPPCQEHIGYAADVMAALVLAGHLQVDIQDLIEASSLGTPGAKALRASVTDEQVQRVIDRAREIEARGSRPDPDNPDDFLCAFYFPTGELCERAAGHSGECTPNGDLDSYAARNRRGLALAGYTKTGGGAGDTPPAASAAPLDPAAQAGEAIGSPTPPPPQPRRFELYRHSDITGLTGTGVVAWGAQWPDGTASLRWGGKHPSTVAWANVERIIAVHGHQGSTELRWLDDPNATPEGVSA